MGYLVTADTTLAITLSDCKNCIFSVVEEIPLDFLLDVQFGPGLIFQTCIEKD